MNIILLSGGSGKRLWPLSNDVRSKQFIQIFKTPTGEYESMVQRMYRRILALDPKANVLIATSKAQVSELKNQLGEAVKISVEPDRRDTFPAIALAVSYMHDVMEVSEDEPVVVCPIDPMVESDYFAALLRLDSLVRNGTSPIFLLGKHPTSPSEKYGYIIPSKANEVASVESFKEKPTSAVAKEYISKGALWNMGVFGFKLGYIWKKSKEMLGFLDYADLFARFSEMPKISFDYAVLEKEKNIGVLRFNGMWDDLGTWESLSKVMGQDIIGKALERGCRNTRIINELDLPIVTLGIDNAVVIGSPEGILVASLDKANEIKEVVDGLGSEGVRYAEKSWGKYEVINMDDHSLTINIILKKGHRMSYHSHSRRNEVWTIVSGTGTTIVDGMSQHVHPGDVVTMQAGCRHTIIADEDLKIIEVQLGEHISNTDKKKYDYEG